MIYTAFCFEDWLTIINRSTELFHGVRPLVGPGNQVKVSVDDNPVTEAERLRIVYTLIASPVLEGGAGITPGLHPWDWVEFISPLMDSKFNKVSSPNFNVCNRIGMDSNVVKQVVNQ